MLGDYVIERLANSTFVLRPDYDATVAALGYEPPLSIPVECTFEWLNATVEQRLQKERRAAARAKKTATTPPGVSEAPKPKPKAPRTTTKPLASGQRRRTTRKES